MSVHVLIAGASGFIGTQLARACLAAGHTVTCASRSRCEFPGAHHLPLDYTSLPPPAQLAGSLQGIDVVVNAVGILRPRGAQTFEAVHSEGPRALFAAAAAAGVRRIVQVSALGAAPDALADYHRSKSEADRALMMLPVDWAIVMPSLVYGAGGASASMFDTLASLPLIPLPAGGLQRIQPVHITDLVAVLLRLLESPVELRCSVPVVGPIPITLAQFLKSLRIAMGMDAAVTVAVPRPLINLTASIGDHIPSAFLSRETWGMLERGNIGDPTALTRLLGRAPLPVSAFIADTQRSAARLDAILGWMAPLLRISVAFMWIMAGLVSMRPDSLPGSLALLYAMGLSPAVAPVVLYGSAVLDLLLGILTLMPRRRRSLWSVQIVLVLTYTVIISAFLPWLWLEPFGPVVKNLPILALLLLLRHLETPR